MEQKLTREEKREMRQEKKAWNEMLRRASRKGALLSHEPNDGALYAIEGDTNAGAAAAEEHQRQAAESITNQQS